MNNLLSCEDSGVFSWNLLPANMAAFFSWSHWKSNLQASCFWTQTRLTNLQYIKWSVLCRWRNWFAEPITILIFPLFTFCHQAEGKFTTSCYFRASFTRYSSLVYMSVNILQDLKIWNNYSTVLWSEMWKAIFEKRGFFLNKFS